MANSIKRVFVNKQSSIFHVAPEDARDFQKIPANHVMLIDFDSRREFGLIPLADLELVTRSQTSEDSKANDRVSIINNP